MPIYIAFLRGINVGGHNRMKMDELRAVFESLGYENVETYIHEDDQLDEEFVASWIGQASERAGELLD